MREKTKGLNVKKLTIILIIIGTVFFGLTIASAMQVLYTYDKVNVITDDYIVIQSEINNLQSASDFLTEVSRQFIITGQIPYEKKYFYEVNVERRRENAIENIKAKTDAMDLTAIDYVEKALEESNKLMKREIHAMALISATFDESVQLELSPEILSFELSDDEKQLDNSEKTNRAYNLLFGDEYRIEKEIIIGDISGATDNLLKEVDDYKEYLRRFYNVSFTVLIVLLVLSASIFVTIAVCLIVFILRPLSTSVEAIKHDKLIPYSKTYELNYLAATYNTVYEHNATTRRRLRDKAQRDELTGLLNRSAFNELENFYKDSTEEMAFLIIDVDHFKEVNDTYGHSVGDAALKRVAELLEECFRANDFPIRYGGDEFAVIMTEIKNHQTGVIQRKIEYINEMLQKPIDESVPAMSISVGIALSENGFYDGLFEKADTALYNVKKNGRCGYEFAIDKHIV